MVKGPGSIEKSRKAHEGKVVSEVKNIAKTSSQTFKKKEERKRDFIKDTAQRTIKNSN